MCAEHSEHSQSGVAAVDSALSVTSFSGVKKGSKCLGGVGENWALWVLRVADRNNALTRRYLNALSVPHTAARLTPGDAAVAGIYFRHRLGFLYT
jgi:hypothetical protein